MGGGEVFANHINPVKLEQLKQSIEMLVIERFAFGVTYNAKNTNRQPRALLRSYQCLKHVKGYIQSNSLENLRSLIELY